MPTHMWLINFQEYPMEQQQKKNIQWKKGSLFNKYINSKVLRYSMVTIIDNTILYN